MSSRSRSPSQHRKRSESEEKSQGRKLFITNLDGKADTKELETELTRLFEKYGPIDGLVVKRNRNSQYCFAFVEMKTHQAAADCVKNFDQANLAGKQIKVEFQDDGKRRKDSNKGCYNCGKKGHFARECRAPRTEENGNGYGRRERSYSKSRDRSEQRHRKHKRHRRSRSSDRDRSYEKDKKRRHRSKDRDEKKKKRYKRSRSSD